uniref:putative nucleobase-ascorbate transporter 10 n=1 Tax=Erigeron canadensis TaxID=72917 RepID=UPI001CB90217|nr:putative nucleobase-ascorbate transporter 10 [Erigeron canadensis]
MEQLSGVQYCVNSSPPWKEAVLLGFQHYILTLGTAVLIPTITVSQMGGDNVEKAKAIQTLLFLSGINTLTQTTFGTRLPSVVGGSHSFLVPVMSIIRAKRYNAFQESHERFAQTMRGVQGALILASVFQTILGFLGLWRNIVRYLSPLSIVPLVTFTGFGLYYLAFPMLGKCVAIGLAELVLIVLISQYLPLYITSKKTIFERYAVLLSVTVSWICAGIFTWSGAYGKSTEALTACRTNTSGLTHEAPWIYIPYPFQWGTPTFDAGEVFVMMVASFVSSIESTGSFLATARYGSATPVPPCILNRGICWLGFANFLGSMCGTVTGFSASIESCGALAFTKVGSRLVIQISAAFMIFFSVFGKFGAVFASIPLPITAALYCIFFGSVSSVGLSHLQFCNLNSFRTKIILGFSFSVGLSVSQFFREHWAAANHSPLHTHSSWFNNMVSVLLMSHASVAVMIAMVLDCTLGRINDENGKDWWDKFTDYGKDIRTDEFYRLPWKLNKLFPAF